MTIADREKRRGTVGKWKLNDDVGDVPVRLTFLGLKGTIFVWTVTKIDTETSLLGSL